MMKKSDIQSLQQFVDDYIDLLVSERDDPSTPPRRRIQLVRYLDTLRELNRELGTKHSRTSLTALIHELVELITRLFGPG